MNRRRLVVGLGVTGFGAKAMHPHRSRAADDSTVTANIATVRSFYVDMMNARNPDAANGIISPDYVSSDPSNAPGVDAYIARLISSFQGFDYQWKSAEYVETAIIAQDDVVVYRGELKGESKDGKLIELEFVSWFQLKEALITEWWGGPDSGKLSEQLYG